MVKKKEIDPPTANLEIFKKEFELAQLTFDERQELAMKSRDNQRSGPSSEVVRLATGRKVEIYGTSEVKVL